MKGLSVRILKTPGWECSNNGVTSKHNVAILIGEQVDGPLQEIIVNAPVLVLVKRKLYSSRAGSYREYLHAEPAATHGKAAHLFGGSFIFTSDSRFPNDYPIPVHDRIE